LFVLFCVKCVVFVLRLIGVPLPPGKTPLSVKIIIITIIIIIVIITVIIIIIIIIIIIMDVKLSLCLTN
jgi:hypothetical protein